MSDQLRPPTDNADLREQLKQLTNVERHDSLSKTTHLSLGTINAIMGIVHAEGNRREDNVITIANSTPCDCGSSEHFATPVRSVTGKVTKYCQFSRIRPSQLQQEGRHHG